MRLDRPTRRQRPISLTPLVDVIFLLLLFFMLSSTFTTFGEIDLGAPAAGGGAGKVPEALLTIADTRLRLNGRDIDATALEDEARALVDRQIGSLLILTRGETTTQQLVEIMSRLKTFPDLKVTVAGAQ
ncbi:MAG: hypothetical protein Tsb0019_16990 [Roseibium sp.]